MSTTAPFDETRARELLAAQTGASSKTYATPGATYLSIPLRPALRAIIAAMPADAQGRIEAALRAERERIIAAARELARADGRIGIACLEDAIRVRAVPPLAA